MNKLKRDYLKDNWNYYAVLGAIFFWVSSFLDVVNDKVSDDCRILFVVSLGLALIKLL